jgi:hypothetical protein
VRSVADDKNELTHFKRYKVKNKLDYLIITEVFLFHFGSQAVVDKLILYL